MAFTKVVGAGIHTLSNITSHNINSSGIITATKFVGPIEAVDGTFTGNVTIGGTLTYEDVKNVDSVGVITARSGINVIGHSELDNLNVSGVSTFSGIATASSTLFAKNFSTSGIGTFADIHVKNPVDTRITSIAPGALILSRDTPIILFKNNLSDSFDASIDVVSNELRFKGGGNNATSTRMITTSSGVSFPQNIDVDGRTDLDDVVISGVSTFTGRIDANDNIAITSGNRLYFGNSDVAFIKGEHGGSGYLSFGVNNEHMRLTRAGNLGIGTDNPNHELTIFGDTPNIRLSHTGSTNTLNVLYTQVDGTGVEWNSYQDGTGTKRPFIFKQYLTERLRIDSAGKVGIGSADPPVMHHLYSASGGLYTRFEAPMGSVNFGNSNGAGIIQVTSTSQPLRILVNGTNERLRIDSSGRILTGGETATEVSYGGIHIKTANNGGNTQALILENHGSASDTTVTLKLVPSTSTPNDRYNSIKAINVDGQNKFDTVFHTCPGGTPLEAMRIDNQQRVIIGTQYTDTRHEVGDAALQVSGTGPNDSGIAVGRWSNNNHPAFLELSKSRATSITGHTAVQADDILGQVQFSGSDGTRYLGAAFVKGIATNPIADYDVAGYLSFGTNYGTTSPTERMRLDKDGRLRVASTTESADAAFDDLIVGNHSGNRGISILSGSSSQGALGFAKSGTLADGYVAYNHNSTATSSSMVIKSSGKIQFNAGSSEKFTITDAGQVQVKVTTQSTLTTNGALVVSGGIGVAKNIICGGALEVQNNTLTVTSATPNILMAVPSGGLDSRIYNDGSGNFIIGHGTNSSAPTERLRIDSNGRVMIGSSDVGRSGAQNLTIGSTAGDQGMTIRSGTSHEGNIYFSDGSSGGNEESRGIFRFDHSNDSFQFYTASGNNFSQERLRIASTGELGLGLTQDPPTGSFTMRLTETPEFNLYSTQHAQNNNCKINFGIGQSASVDGNTGARIEMNIPNSGGQMTGELKFHTNVGDSLNERLRITHIGGTVINKGGTINTASGWAALEAKASSSAHQVVLSSTSTASNSNYATLGFKLHPSNDNERVKAAIQCQGSGGGYGEVSRMMFCLDNVADNGNAQGNGSDERFRISPTTGVQVYRDKFGWSTFGHHTGSARTLLRHVKEFGTGSSAATFNLIRVRRHYWGWGHYKFTIKRAYYSGIAEDVYYLNGHGRDDGSYSPSYSIGQRQYGGDGSNFGYSNRITITSPSTSSPGSTYAAYVDVRLECPAYMYFQVEVEAYTSTYSTDYTSLASDQYALHP